MLDAKLTELSIQLPPVPPLGGIYHPVVVVGNLMYVSGQVSFGPDGALMTGVVGQDLTWEEGKMAARYAGLTMLATIRDQLGSLDRIKRLVKTLGMVNCQQGFTQQPQVINGFSELIVEVLGEQNGKGARSAVGMVLPRNAAVEVEAIFELHP